jgi:hypothetical protein
MMIIIIIIIIIITIIIIKQYGMMIANNSWRFVCGDSCYSGSLEVARWLVTPIFVNVTHTPYFSGCVETYIWFSHSDDVKR